MTATRTATASILNLSDPVTPAAPHVRDSVNLQRLANWVVLALLPALIAALFETGRQVFLAGAQPEASSSVGWTLALLNETGIPTDLSSSVGDLLRGVLVFLPIFAVAMLTGAFWQHLFARSRHASAPGLAATVLLFSLAVPPSIALWQVAVGMTFGIVVGQEIFGGTGKNLLHPAAAGLAFLYFAYPNALSTFASQVPTPAVMIGAALLLYTRAISWRVLAAGIAGVAGYVLLAQSFSDSAALAEMPWYRHLTAGGFAFGLVFLASDPVTAATTNPGRCLYGACIGVFTVLIRTVTSHTQEVLLAILLGNLIAPLIDYGVMEVNIRRRLRRVG